MATRVRPHWGDSRLVPGAPRVVIAADEARALDESARDQRRQRAQRAGRPTTAEVLGPRPGVRPRVDAARRAPDGRPMFDPTPAQRPGRARGPRGRTRHGWRREQPPSAEQARRAVTTPAKRQATADAFTAFAEAVGRGLEPYRQRWADLVNAEWPEAVPAGR